MAIFGIGNIIKIAGLAIAGLVGYTLIKNSGKIGASVGSFAGTGLRDLGTGISEGFATTFDIFGGSPNANTGGAISQDDPNLILTDTPRTVTDPAIGVVTPNPIEEGFTPIAKSFGPFVARDSVTRKFAETYSFQPPAQPMASGIGHQLDVSDTFSYINSEAYKSRATYSQANADALASEIAKSAERYPEWFA